MKEYFLLAVIFILVLCWELFVELRLIIKDSLAVTFLCLVSFGIKFLPTGSR